MNQTNNPECTGERLVKVLAAAGIASRRGAGDLVKAGRVTVNGRTVTEPGEKVRPGDRVEFDGQAIGSEAKHYILLHKPRGYVCTNADPHARLKAVDLIRLDPPCRLFSAGRLDKESEGLILFSNDGDFVARLTHPRYEVFKTYEVTTDVELGKPELDKIRGGIFDAGDFLRVRSVEPLGDRRYRFVLSEGKKREIRRLIAACDARTERLVRLQVGRLPLGGLRPGEWRELTPQEAELALNGIQAKENRP